MRAWVKLRDGVTVEGYESLVAVVESAPDYPGCVWLLDGRGRRRNLTVDNEALETRRLLMPLSSIAWMTP